MNRNEFKSIWQRLANGEPIDAQETLAFAEQMVEDESSCLQVADERTIDALLQLHGLSHPSHEAFVNACLNQIANGPIEPSADPESDDSIKGLGVLPLGPDSETPSETNFSISKPAADVISVGHDRRTRKRSRQKAQPLWIALATVFVILVGSSAWVFLRPSGTIAERGNAPGTAQPKVVDAEPVGRPFTPEQVDGTRTNPIDRTEDPTLVENDSVDRAIDQMFDEGSEAKRIANNKDKSLPTEFGNPLDVNAGNQTPRTPFDDPSLIGPEQPWVISPRPAGGQAFATLVNAGNIDLESIGIDPRLGQQDLSFASGQGRIDFDCGMQVMFQAPAKMTLNSDHSIALREGDFIFDARPKLGGFEIQTRCNLWNIGERSELQIRIQSDGQLEAFVHRGTAHVAPLLVSGSNKPLRLSFARLNQVFVRPLGNDDVASLTLARGKAHFTGQIGIAGTVWESDSPSEVGLVTNGLSLREDHVDETEFQRKWTHFVADAKKLNRREENFNDDMVSLVTELMQPLATEDDFDGNRNPDASVISTFEGMININGQERRFNSKVNYDRAARDAIQEGMLPNPGNGMNGGDGGVALPIGARPPKFDRAVDILGPLQRFSDPAVFNAIRKQLRK